MTFLGALAPLMNGAAVQVFPGDASPINIIATLVNYPQTRKSQNTKLVKSVADVLDKHVGALADRAVTRALTAQAADGDAQMEALADKKPRLQVASSTLTCFTPEVFFERFSGDYQQLQNAADLGVQDWGPFGRTCSLPNTSHVTRKKKYIYIYVYIYIILYIYIHIYLYNLVSEPDLARYRNSMRRSILDVWQTSTRSTPLLHHLG